MVTQRNGVTNGGNAGTRADLNSKGAEQLGGATGVPQIIPGFWVMPGGCGFTTLMAIWVPAWEQDASPRQRAPCHLRPVLFVWF